jgi:hypothetical protein
VHLVDVVDRACRDSLLLEARQQVVAAARLEIGRQRRLQLLEMAHAVGVRDEARIVGQRLRAEGL